MHHLPRAVVDFDGIMVLDEDLLDLDRRRGGANEQAILFADAEAVSSGGNRDWLVAVENLIGHGEDRFRASGGGA